MLWLVICVLQVQHYYYEIHCYFWQYNCFSRHNKITYNLVFYITATNVKEKCNKDITKFVFADIQSRECRMRLGLLKSDDCFIP